MTPVKEIPAQVTPGFARFCKSAKREVVSLNGKKDAVDAWAAALEPQPEVDADLLRFLLGRRTALGHLGQRGDGLHQSIIPAGSGVGGSPGDPSECFDSIRSRPWGENDTVAHRPCFSARICRISAKTS